jgi:hypothetical protein
MEPILVMTLGCGQESLRRVAPGYAPGRVGIRRGFQTHLARGNLNALTGVKLGVWRWRSTLHRPPAAAPRLPMAGSRSSALRSMPSRTGQRVCARPGIGRDRTAAIAAHFAARRSIRRRVLCGNTATWQACTRQARGGCQHRRNRYPRGKWQALRKPHRRGKRHPRQKPHPLRKRR